MDGSWVAKWNRNPAQPAAHDVTLVRFFLPSSDSVTPLRLNAFYLGTKQIYFVSGRARALRLFVNSIQCGTGRLARTATKVDGIGREPFGDSRHFLNTKPDGSWAVDLTSREDESVSPNA